MIETTGNKPLLKRLIDRLVSWPFYLGSLFVCFVTICPGYIILAVYGTTPLTALPLFWGGVIYKRYLEYDN